MSQSMTCGKCKKYIKFVSSGDFIDTDEMCNCNHPVINLAEGTITETGEPLSLANKSGNGYVEHQPTIADYLEVNKEMIDKTGCKVVTIASLRKFGGLDGGKDFHCSVVSPQFNNEELVNEAMEIIDSEIGDRSKVEDVVFRMIAAGYRREIK